MHSNPCKVCIAGPQPNWDYMETVAMRSIQAKHFNSVVLNSFPRHMSVHVSGSQVTNVDSSDGSSISLQRAVPSQVEGSRDEHSQSSKHRYTGSGSDVSSICSPSGNSMQRSLPSKVERSHSKPGHGDPDNSSCYSSSCASTQRSIPSKLEGWHGRHGHEVQHYSGEYSKARCSQ